MLLQYLAFAAFETLLLAVVVVTPGEYLPALAEGLVYVLPGALVLRLWTFAPVAVSMIGAFQLASLVSSWRLWDEFGREMVTRRRAFQGLPVRDGEVDLLQMLMP
jgi:hypothetical protein